MSLADDARAKDSLFGHTVFPSQKTMHVFGMNISSEVISAIIEERQREGAEHDWFVPFLIGCVTYNSAFDATRHQTGFIFSIDRFKDGYPSFGFLKSDGDIPKDAILLRLWPKPARVD